MTAPSIVIASYNILADAYIKPEYYPRCDPQDFAAKRRHPKLLDRVAGLGADVACLQEAEQDLFDRIRSRLGTETSAFWAQKTGGKPDGCATFVRRPWTCRAWRRLAFHDGHAAKPAGHVALIAELVRDGLSLTVVNTHLRWDPPETASEERRGLAQAKQLLSELAKHPSPYVVCGDFNAELGGEVLGLFRAYGFSDAHEASASTCNANGRARKIDFLLHTRALTARPMPPPSVTDATPLPSPAEPSDHVPLVAAFISTTE